MKAMAVVSTQLQLINCVEYLSLYNIDDCDLIVFSTSKMREKQINYLLLKESYRFFFKRILYTNYTPNRLSGVLSTILTIFKIKRFINSNIYNCCILGNYKFCEHRLCAYYCTKNDKNTNIYVVDDGTATVDILVDRKIELQTGHLIMFTHNKVLRMWFNNRAQFFIPKSIVFFTIYDLSLSEYDRLIRNGYSYLKNNASSFSIPVEVLSADVIFLGQPYVQNGIVTSQRYNEYLQWYSKRTPNLAKIYLPHPEELDSLALDETTLQDYSYYESQISFEILYLALVKQPVIVSFNTSALVSVIEMNPNANIEAIYTPEIEISSDPSIRRIVTVYEEFKRRGINIIYPEVKHEAE